VPVPAVLAVDASGRLGPWQYLIQEHVAGLPWRQVRPLLDEEDVDAAHRELAEAVLAIQTVRFDGFGELGHSGRPEAGTLLAAVRRRADRILRERDRERFLELLVQAEQLFADAGAPATLCHDDLHHDNVVFAQQAGRWRLAGVLDWDKAWSGPTESDVARMAFWDDMTGPAFWRVYDEAVPVAGDREQRMAIYQLLWCLEFDDGSSRHADDTADLWHRLITRLP
jgi:aminoglycoside phosphotransferase (APT) family kinase protein